MDINNNLTTCNDFIKMLSKTPDNSSICVFDEVKNMRCDNIVVKAHDPLHIISIQPISDNIECGHQYTVKEMVEILQKKPQEYIIQLFDKNRGVLCLQNIKCKKSTCDIIVYSGDECKLPTCNGYCYDLFC